MAQHISFELQNNTNKLYLLFLYPILSEVNSVNLLFQGENIDLYSGYEHLVLLFMSICSKLLNLNLLKTVPIKKYIIINNEDCYLDVDDIEFGIECSEELKSLPLSDVIEFKKNCFRYLKILAKEMIKRFPENIKKLEHFRNLQFKNIENKFESVYGILKNSMDDEIAISTYENQPKHTNNNIPKDIFGFWAIVYEYEDNAGNYYFRELATAVFHLLVIPISNAFVERIFSCMNTTKTKLRNKMQYEMLESLIRIKSYLNNYNICFYKFEVPESMVKRFNSDNMYKQQPIEENDDELEAY
ncbi:uncharacterized protein LOC124419555 [Lucilia cuprina]|uniref:uncharacterized protein LOC124419555 n=1 Tax=Lucilia cuprina TaxID=7375 RepID=UPI001F05CDB3|nr:uncharacterized protein LOC124419555 [Lucilia cuprina]